MSQSSLTTMSDIDVSTDSVDSDLVESTSAVSVDLKSADLVKDTHIPEIENHKVLESIDRSIESGKAIEKPISYTLSHSSTNKAIEVTTQPIKNDLSAVNSGNIEAKSSIDSDPTELLEDVDATTFLSVSNAAANKTTTPVPIEPSTLSTNFSSSTTPVTSTSTTTSPPTVTPYKKITDSWLRADSQREPDGVELFLGGIIEALERRIQNSLPAEARLPFDKKDTEMKEFNKANKLDGETNNDGSDHVNLHNLAQPSMNHGVTLNESESQLNGTFNSDKPVVGTIMVKPEADEHLKYSGSVFDPSNVEIITAATPFLHDIAQPDSILVNLSSTSFKVSTDELRDEKLSKNVSFKQGGFVFDTTSPVNLTNHTDPNAVKPLTMYNLGKDEWKVINHNHRPLNSDIDSSEYFGSKYRSEDMDLPGDYDLSNNSTDTEKKSRSDIDAEGSDLTSSLHPGPGYPNNVKYIPFGSGDVSANFPIHHNKPNSNFTRIPQYRKPPSNHQKQPVMSKSN